jgi:ribosomally synthesized peptide (two-chain TOMM family)
MADLMEQLLSFRTVWLQAVAQAWVDDGFKKNLMDPGGAEAALLSKFGYQWLWGTVRFKVREEESFVWKNDRSGLCSHRRVAVRSLGLPKKISFKRHWDWAVVEQHPECLLLRLPLSADGIDPEDQSRALADFYKSQPTLFGNSGGAAAAVAALPAPHAAAVAPQTAMNRSYDRLETSPYEKFIGPANEFANFQVALISFIARCWQTNRRPSTDKGLEKRLFRGVLDNYCIPWDMLLKIEHDPTTHWDRNAQTWTTPAPHELQLSLPMKPAEPRDFAVALAAYNATGAEFPFSCCCA